MFRKLLNPTHGISLRSIAAIYATLLTAIAGHGADMAAAVSKNHIPRRAIVIHGNAETADSTVIGIYYSREGLDFSDADAPRFLLIDREGKVAFGIGGSLYAFASYDFDGAVDNNEFITYNIPVPNSAEQRQRFGADVSHSTLFTKLVGRSSRFGLYSIYMQANFTGENGGYGFRLKQAYATLGHFTAGLTTSTFVDAAVQAPTIDPQGASGQISDKTMLFRYTSPAYRGLTYALSVELPKVTFTDAQDAEGQYTSKRIPQRVPDIPAYIQYSWGEGHVRAAGVLRNLAYRNLVEGDGGKNHISTCWGLKLSAISQIGPIFQPFGHISYGKGISTYINDVSGNGYDLVPGDAPGSLTPAPSLTWTIGTYAQITPSLLATASLSRAQVFDCASLGETSYRYAMYAAANVFYNIDDNFKVGAEYLHGKRSDYNGQSGSANRFNVLVQYSF